MRKIIFLLIFLSLSLFARIDEYKSDLYYANGIMINVSEKKATEIWDIQVEELFLDKQDSYKKLDKIKNSYNRSQGFFDDLFESLEQKISNEFGWKDLSAYVSSFLTTHNIQEGWVEHIDDLNKQVTSYKQSIIDGHGVIVIAHSQGNYYTNEAYEKLDNWMRDYFHMLGVATPANHVAGFAGGDTTAPYVKFHNDFIKLVHGGLDSNRENPNNEHNGVLSVAAHDFYYSYLTSENTKTDIINFIEEKILEQIDAQSQWATDEEFDKNTKDYKITVKHIYDADIVMDEKVFPFAPNKKLYQVKDIEGTSHYVKASFGGEKIQDEWEEQDERQFYKLEGTDPIEYIVDENKSLPYDMYKFVVFEQFSVMNFQATKVVIIIYGFKNGKKKRIYGKEVPFKKVEGTATFDWSYGYIYDRIFYLHTSSPGIIFFETKDIDDLRSKLMEEWNLKLRYYIYAVGVGNGSLPDAIAEVSFKFENNAIDIIMENK